jgi:ribonuclease III
VRLSADLKAFEARIGHTFATGAHLVRAVTHASIGTVSRPDNQRLEFLGDRVLGLIIARALFTADEAASEGQLAPRFNALVRKETCADIARAIGLGDVLRLGRSEMVSGGRRKEALLGDAMEAVIAAIFLDAGFDATERVVLQLWADRIGTVADVPRDAKTALQEWAQAQGFGLPVYSESAREGPDHAPLFTVVVRLENGAEETARAGSKRAAEQSAAAALLSRLEADAHD